ncbi:MAG: hypothetical protein HOV82_16915 [Streptomyces sp.]|nr:hypothetical protein [Streptomyces sp.]NUP36227.1 hypothetical protein [Streptomyces sp.]NUS75574.1 hypothetical protein [Streptomyces sp.]
MSTSSQTSDSMIRVRPLHEALALNAAESKARAQQRTALTVDCLIDRENLPAPVRIPRAESMHVMVADVDDLGEWLRALGGEIHVSPEFEGVELWTLHASTEPREDGSSTQVLVSVPVPSGELVMDWIRAAVKR